jgi:pyridoxal phosphate enzyme (YggS family)
MSHAVTGIEAAFAARLAGVRARVAAAAARAGRDPADVTLIAVSKTQPAEALCAALAAGMHDFGENYVQEGVTKARALAAGLCGEGVRPRFHLIGHLQRNKVRAALGAFAILHTVDSARLLDAIAAAAPSRPVPVMLQVNVADDRAKAGVPVAGLASLVRAAADCPAVDLVGLMTIPPADPDPEASRPHFATLRTLAHAHGLRALSMGMSNDFEVAIEEGATHIRVGRAIFGERP